MILAYAVPGGGRALIDRELYLPESWTDDRDRCREAGIGDAAEFATRPLSMLALAFLAVTAAQRGQQHRLRATFPDTPAA